MSVKDKIRAATVGKKVEYPSDRVEIEPGVEVIVKALSYDEKSELNSEATKMVWPKNMPKQVAAKKGLIDVEFDQSAYELNLLINCCFDEDDEQVFSRADLAVFKEQPAHEGHWLHRLIDKATTLNKAGNLETTPSD